MPAIEQHGDEYANLIEDYILVNTMCRGEKEVKLLPNIIVNPYQDDTEGKERFTKYLEMACFMSITETTVEQLTGMALSGKHVIEYDESVTEIVNNSDGTGLSVTDQFNSSANAVIKLGRDGILVDYPSVDGKASVKDKKDSNLRARLIRFGAESIFNYRTENGMLVELRLLDSYQELSDDEINYKTKQQVILFRIVEGKCLRSVWRDGEKVDAEKEVTDHNSSAFDHIPFHFIGATSNSPAHDKIPMLKIANFDKKILQNSADSEINAHMTSGALMVIGLDSRIDPDTFQKTNGKVNLGVFASLNVGQDGHADYKQARDSDSSRKLLQDKIEMARQIGAKLIVNKAVQNTKVGAQSDLTESTSALKTIVTNCAKAYESAFADVFLFETGKEGKFTFEPNFDFAKETLDAAMIALYPELVDARIVLPIEARIKLKEAGLLPELVDGKPLSHEDALLRMQELPPVDTV